MGICDSDKHMHCDVNVKLKKLQQQDMLQQQTIHSLESDVEKLFLKITNLKNNQYSLSTSISEMYKYIKAEIELKDRLINQLRSKLHECTKNNNVPIKRPGDDKPIVDKATIKKMKVECDNKELSTETSIIEKVQIKNSSNLNDMLKQYYNKKSNNSNNTDNNQSIKNKCETDKKRTLPWSDLSIVNKKNNMAGYKTSTNNEEKSKFVVKKPKIPEQLEAKAKDNQLSNGEVKCDSDKVIITSTKETLKKTKAIDSKQQKQNNKTIKEVKSREIKFSEKMCSKKIEKTKKTQTEPSVKNSKSTKLDEGQIPKRILRSTAMAKNIIVHNKNKVMELGQNVAGQPNKNLVANEKENGSDFGKNTLNSSNMTLKMSIALNDLNFDDTIPVLHISEIDCNVEDSIDNFLPLKCPDTILNPEILLRDDLNISTLEESKTEFDNKISQSLENSQPSKEHVEKQNLLNTSSGKKKRRVILKMID